MYFIYCDDAGNTGDKLNDALQPFHVLGGIAFRHTLWESIALAAENCCKHHFTQWGIEHSAEIHAKEIWNRSGSFKTTTPQQRLDFFHDLLDGVRETGSVHHLWGAADKAKMAASHVPYSPIDVSAWMLVEHIAEFCHTRRKKCVVIIDRCIASKSKIKSFITMYRKECLIQSHPKADLSCIYDNAHFIDSQSSRHIQISDLLNYILVRKLRNAPDQYDFNTLFRHVSTSIGTIYPP